MNKKILMIYPETPTTYWSFDYALPFVEKKASLPPLGLMTVAAMLPDTYEVRLLDMNVMRLSRKDIEEADLVFISAMIVQQQSFAEVVRVCRECGKPVVAGGPYPISSYGQIEGVDHFVLDEAELTLPRFLKDLENGRPKKLYRDPRKPDITLSPPPRFDLIDVQVYNSMSLQFSRGCPYNCEFCDIIEMFGRRLRTKTPAQFIREMEAVLEAGFSGPLFIVDDNFIGNRRKTKELLHTVATWQKEHGFPFTLSTEASIDLAQDEKLLDLMVEARFTMVFVGIETPDEKTLKYTQKGQNLKSDILASVRKIHSRGIEVAGGFILGFDTDPQDIFELQTAFIQKAGIPIAMVGLLNAVPNTQLARRLAKEGRLLGETTGNNTHTLPLNFLPRMPEKELIEGYKQVLGFLYSPRSYFRRCSTLFSCMPVRKKTARSASLEGIKALLRSIIKQAFSPYGLRYLHFLIKTLITRPGLFPDAVALAIKGYHLFRLTEDILKADEFSTLLATTEKTFQLQVGEVQRKGEKRLAEALERHILRLLEQLKRKHERFDHGVQQHLQEALAHFSQSCANWVRSLRLVSAS